MNRQNFSVKKGKKNGQKILPLREGNGWNHCNRIRGYVDHKRCWINGFPTHPLPHPSVNTGGNLYLFRFLSIIYNKQLKYFLGKFVKLPGYAVQKCRAGGKKGHHDIHSLFLLNKLWLLFPSACSFKNMYEKAYSMCDFSHLDCVDIYVHMYVCTYVFRYLYLLFSPMGIQILERK